MTIFMLAGLLVPFILITDIFPFLRFGMFAEPIKKNIQTEKFLIYQTDTSGRRTLLDPDKIGINPNTFYYLCRNYIYRNETKEFSEKLFTAANPEIATLEILHLIAPDLSHPYDTIFTGKYQKK